jgi:hypothetical protein
LDIFGYSYYLVAVLLPGLGAAELLGLVREDGTLLEASAYVVGLGLSIDTGFIFAATSGIDMMGVHLAGAGIADFYSLVILGFTMLFASLVLKRRFTVPRVTATDFGVLLLMLLQAGMLFLYFSKYPIFPQYESADYANHVEITNSLLSRGTSIPSGILYYGVHYQLALGVLLTGGPTLIVAQRVVGILAILATPLVYVCGWKLFRSSTTGLFASFLYSLPAAIWFSSLFASGLYPNFFGVLSSLFLLVCFVDSLEAPGLRTWVALILATVMLYLSHYSSLALLPVVMAAPILIWMTGRLKPKLLAGVILVLLPGVAGIAIFPKLVTTLLTFLANPGGAVIGETGLASLLSVWPVISALALETSYDIGFILLISLAVLGSYLAIRARRDPIVLFALIWLLGVLLVAPLNQGAWRFAFVALTPLTLIASYGLSRLVQSQTTGKRRQRPFPWRKALAVVLLLTLVAGSWGATELSDSLLNTKASASAQADVYNAITWMNSNIPRRVSILSVSDWRFDYVPLLIGRTETYRLIIDPNTALAFARSNRFGYIVVTKAVTASLAEIGGVLPWYNFPTSSNQNLTLVYSNSDVRIYQVAAPSS